MNLYSRGAGLFGTHVTWDDVEDNIKGALDTNASFGPDQTARMIAHDKGFLSKVILVEPDWQHKDKTLPDKFVVKIATLLAMPELNSKPSEQTNVESIFDNQEFKINVELELKQLHNSEISAYEFLKDIPKDKFPRAEVYFMKEFSDSNPVKGYIIMEYLGDYDYNLAKGLWEYLGDLKFMEIYENVAPKALSKVLRAMAIMEAASLKLTAEEKSKFTQHPFSQPCAKLSRRKFLENMKKPYPDCVCDHMELAIEKSDEFFRSLTNFEWADQLSDELGMQRVLCHGDLSPANIFWKGDGEDAELAALIDFQGVHMGCPAIDLVQLFASCLSGKDRREHCAELIEEFYGYLVEEVGDGEMPYTRTQLKKSYVRFFPMAGFMTLQNILRFCKGSKIPNEDERVKNFVVTEKINSLFDDIRLFHTINHKGNGYGRLFWD